MFSKLSLIHLSHFLEAKRRPEPCVDAQTGEGDAIGDTEVLESVETGDGFTEVGIRKMSYAEACAAVHPVMNSHYVCSAPFVPFDEEAWAVREVEKYEQACGCSGPKVSEHVYSNLDFDEKSFISRYDAKGTRARRNSRLTRRHG